MSRVRLWRDSVQRMREVRKHETKPSVLQPCRVFSQHSQSA